MSFIRPEAQEQIWRWREAISGAGALFLGAWMTIQGRGFLAMVGIVLTVLAIGLIVAGWQRARFRKGHGGAGVVQVTEGQVAYYGPYVGGAVATASITEVRLQPQPGTDPVWILSAAGSDPLMIPTNATNADALFDVFGALEKFETETMLAALENPGDLGRVIWTRRLLH